MINNKFILLLIIALQNICLIAADNGELTDSEKLYELSLLWKEAGCNFAHFDAVPDLDWD